MILSPVEIAGAVVIVAFGAWVQGSIGFGVAIVAAPFLILIEPDLVPGPLIANAVVLTLLMTYRERKSIDMGAVRWAAIGSSIGVAAGAGVMSVISPEGFDILFSVLVIVAVLASALGSAVSVTRKNMFTAGTLSGFMGTISSIGGPPVALVYQREPGPKLRGTLSAYFCFTGIIALVALALVGKFGTSEATLTGVLLPGLVAGFAISSLTAGALDRHSMRPAVLLLSAGAAVAVLVRAIV